MKPTTLREAAALRSGQVRTAADRPSQRRSLEAPNSPARTPGIGAQVELRASSSKDGFLEFDGYASVTGHGYEMWDWAGPYTELVTPGAFATSLARSDLDVPFVLAHDSLRRIARTTTGTLLLAEDDHGLRAQAPELDPADADVAYIAPKLRAGLIDEMSFRFFITKGQWSPDWTEYHIEEVDIHRGDVAIVGYGANPATAGSGLRSADLASLVRDASDEQAREALDLLQQRMHRPVTIHDHDVALRTL
jgi:HK97 family phage prohead protease